MSVRLERSVHLLPAGGTLECEEWRDAVAVVAAGEVEVRAALGGRLRLVQGDVLCLARLGPAAVLAAVGGGGAVVRRPPVAAAPPAPSDHHHDPRKDPDMDMKLELVPVPVTDIDRAAAYYERLGFVRDVDHSPADGVRVVQLTPAGSACSIVLSTGLDEIDMAPGSVRGLHLVVDDIARARQELLDRGVEVGDVVAVGGGVSYARLVDPDGNTLTLQQMDWRTGDAF